MTDATVIWAVTIISAVAIFYIWSNRGDHRRREPSTDQQHLLLEVHRELARQHTVMLNRCAELQRALDHQRRTLRYVAKRLS